MFLKYNIKTHKPQSIEIKINKIEYDNEKSLIKVTTINNPHILRNNDKIFVKYNVLGIDFSDYIFVKDVTNDTFSFNFSTTKSFKIIKNNGNNFEHNVVLYDSAKNKIYPNKEKTIQFLNLNEIIEFSKDIINKNKIVYNNDDELFYKINGFNDIEKYTLTFFYVENEKEYKIKLTSDIFESFKLTVVTNNAIEAETEITFDDNIFYNQNHVLNFNWEDFNIENILFYTNQLNIPINFIKNDNIGLNNELDAQLYFNEKKKEIITEIIDYEKKCFIPYYYEHNNEDDPLKPVYKITFNLYFRDRNNNYDSWDSNDSLFWHQKYNETKPSNITNGDYLGKLGFNDDDVYYRKLKLQKTFLRLNFYDKNNPFKKMLLFYSTVFMDTGDLYGKYIKNINKKENTENNNIVDSCSDLTCSFSVSDKFEQTKSSEGFYLYLFPDYLEGTGRTIYMCVDFNHAGYGKTIPFMAPFDDNKTSIDFGNKNFPLSLIDENNTLKPYFKYLHIPLVLKYDNDKKEYIYYFSIKPSDKSNSSFRFDYNNGELIINLYEPKLNDVGNGNN